MYSAATAARFGVTVNDVAVPPSNPAGIVSVSVLVYPDPAVVAVTLVTDVALAITTVTINPDPLPVVLTGTMFVNGAAKVDPVGDVITGIVLAGKIDPNELIHTSNLLAAVLKEKSPTNPFAVSGAAASTAINALASSKVTP